MTGSNAIILSRHGGPEVLELRHVEVAPPGPGMLRVRHEAIGVNYHDIYVRSGLYRTLALPGIPGLEGVGVVEKVGPGSEPFSPGDRIAYLYPGYGAYASHRLLPADAAIPLPDGIDPLLACGILLKGLTAGVLATKAHRLEKGDVALVHAAAGGVGHLLCQWAVQLGAKVFATVGSDEKAALLAGYGCAAIINYAREDFADRVLELTTGRGADVVYDAVGAATFDGSLRALAVRGHLAVYGQSSGPIPPFELSRLAPKSASITRVGYSHYLPDATARRAMAASLFNLVARGTLVPRAPRILPLSQAAEAHRQLEARALGPIILVPDSEKSG